MKFVGVVKSGLSYVFFNRTALEEFEFGSLPPNRPKFITKVNSSSMAVCLWVSPKRTRSYPYARVYDILTQNVSKKVSIIPIVKDEGIEGDRDFLQWDTVSLMSLLNVYVIPAYYCYAEKVGNKLKNQRFDWSYIRNKLIELSYYHHTALHWNLKELEKENLTNLIEKVIECYSKLSKSLGVKMHSEKGLEDFKRLIYEGVENFKLNSRLKAMSAQNREVNTSQPKEFVKMGHKAKIDIENYLGGIYHLTIDEYEYRDGIFYLYECKHAKNSLLPSVEDIKDGLIKIMLLKSIDELYVDGKPAHFKPAIKLTSSKHLSKSLMDIINSLRNGKRKNFFLNLLKEAKYNNFEVAYYGSDNISP